MEYQVINQKLTKVEKIKYFFSNPSKIFEEVNYEITSEFYFLIIILFSTITNCINSIFLKDHLKPIIIQNLQNSVLDKYAAEYAEMLTKPFAQGMVSILDTSVHLLFISLFYYFVLQLLSYKEKYKPEFKEVFNVYLIAHLAIEIGNLIKSIFMIITKNTIFLSFSKTTSFKSILINKFDPFLFWKMFLLTLGFSIVFKYSKKKSALIIILIWIGSISMLFYR